jgi:C4-dicarboxylate-specific signal transduction histidine kinase
MDLHRHRHRGLEAGGRSSPKTPGHHANLFHTALPDGTIDYLNERWIAYLGATSKSILNGTSHPVPNSVPDVSTLEPSLAATVHPDDLRQFLREWRAIVASCKPGQFESRIRRSDGVYRWFLFDVAPLLDENSEVTRWHVASIDINERKRAEVALKQSEQSLRATQARLLRATEIATLAELSASIAYEIYQPLGAVVSHGDACQIWLSADPPNLERASLSAQRIVRDAKSAAEVIGRIRTLFRHVHPKKALLDLNDVLSEVLHLFADDIQQKNVVLESRVAPVLPVVYADRIQMQQVFGNLLQNGLDAMESVEDRPRILTVESMKDTDRVVVISVSDSGTGLQDAGRIYEPFFTTKETRVGMGLAISRSVVEAHGGTLQAKPNQLYGTIFTVSLPLIGEPPLASAD